MNRRNFLVQSGGAALMAAATPALAHTVPSTRKFGINLFSLPKMLDQDFEKGIKWLAGLGYRELEVFGPYTISHPSQIERWKQITPSLGFTGSGLFGKSVADVRDILLDNNMTVPSMHTDIMTLQERMGELAEMAHMLGATYVTLPSIPPEMRKNLDDYKRTAEIFNQIGGHAAKHGVKFAYHNHGYGLKKEGDIVPIELVLDGTDPATVFFELDTFWTVAGGADPVDYLNRYAGRYKLIHLKDMKTIHHFAGDGGTPDQWIELFQYLTYLGDGAMDLPKILTAAKWTGVEHYIVEQDNAPNPEVAIGGSAVYLKELGFV